MDYFRRECEIDRHICMEVRGRWRKLHDEEVHYWYSSPSTIKIIKSRRMKLAEHVA
jgi:hypothetical protein